MSLIHLSCESKTWADVYTVRALCIGGTSFPWHGTLKMFAGVMPFSRTGRCIGIYPVYDDSIPSIGSWNESEASIVTLLCQGCWLSPPSPFLAGLHRHGLGKSGCIAASVILPPGKVIVPVVTVAMLFHALLWNVPWIVHERIATEIWQQQRRFNLGSTEALHPNMHGLPDVPLEAGTQQLGQPVNLCLGSAGCYIFEGLDLYCLDFGVRWVLQVGC